MTRAPYLALTPDQKQALHAWLTDHGVDYKRVPVYADFQRDDATSEWRIPVYWVDDRGRMRIDLDSDGGQLARQHVLRRRELRPLPWPTEVTHHGVEGYDFMPSEWCGGCETCMGFPAPTVCIVCSYDAEGMPAEPVDWPCAHAEAAS